MEGGEEGKREGGTHIVQANGSRHIAASTMYQAQGCRHSVQAQCSGHSAGTVQQAQCSRH